MGTAPFLVGLLSVATALTPAWEDLGQAVDGQDILLAGKVIMSPLGTRLCVPVMNHPNLTSQCVEMDGDPALLSSLGRSAGSCVVVAGRFSAGGKRKGHAKYASEIGVITLEEFEPWRGGCSSPAPPVEAQAAPKPQDTRPSIGENYAVARQRLMASGWKPVQANCSPQNLCFDYPEQATDMQSAATCGSFANGASSMRICVDVINDGMLVKSVQEVQR